MTTVAQRLTQISALASATVGQHLRSAARQPGTVAQLLVVLSRLASATVAQHLAMAGGRGAADGAPAAAPAAPMPARMLLPPADRQPVATTPRGPGPATTNRAADPAVRAVDTLAPRAPLAALLRAAPDLPLRA